MALFIRICAWFTTVIFGLMTFIGIGLMSYEGYNSISLLTVVLCLITALTGWNARRAGLVNYEPVRFSKVFAIVTLLGGIFFTIVFPLIIVTFFEGEDNTFLAIRNIWILFVPTCVSALAILFQHKFKIVKR